MRIYLLLVLAGIVFIAGCTQTNNLIEEVEGEDAVKEDMDVGGEMDVTEFGDKIFVTNGKKHIVPLNEIFQGCLGGKDCIPSIDNPNYASVSESDWLNDDDIVLGFSFEGVNRAYPLRILNWHEIVNDKVNGKPVLISYCPLCGTGIAFERTINENEEVEFGVSGKLHNSDLIMYDRKTETYWGQVTGKAIVGELIGQRLKFLPIDTVKWIDWKNLHPDSEVLTRETGYFRDYDVYPYGDYEISFRIMFPVSGTDDRLFEKAIVYGIEIDNKFKAYPLEELREVEILEETFNGVNLMISIDENNIVKIIDKDTNKAFIPIRSFWFAWYAFHPNTELFLNE